MNVFEDLVVELKEANLLESTVMDGTGPETDVLSDAHLSEPDPPLEGNGAATKRVESDAGFFRKKAVGEVASLQMVEAVITGVEREYMKIVPRSFDDLDAKKALNLFVNSSSPVHSAEYKAAEFELMAQTESWCSSLAARDREFPVTLLRQYCERSRPALSSQALLGLGRFYRNLPYSEPVRSKFDFVITRLFSRPVDKEKRICLFDRSEMLTHINTLYSDWSSISLYSVDEDETNVPLTAMSFDEFAEEAEAASTFDELIETDFFGRLRMFKESISDLFFAPPVTCAAISANIRIGNAYVELIDLERKRSNSESLHDRYAQHEDQVSETTGKTLELTKLLKQLDGGQAERAARPNTKAQGEASRAFSPRPPRASAGKTRQRNQPGARTSFLDGLRESSFSVNKWVLIFGVVMILAATALYVWAGSDGQGKITTAGVRVFEVEKTPLKEHLKSAHIIGDTFYGQALPTWDALSREERQEFLQRLYQTAAENGCKQVSVMGTAGKSVGYASAGRIEVASP